LDGDGKEWEPKMSRGGDSFCGGVASIGATGDAGFAKKPDPKAKRGAGGVDASFGGDGAEATGVIALGVEFGFAESGANGAELRPGNEPEPKDKSGGAAGRED
jgi:hypothetical protein